MNFKIMIVDDEYDIRELLKEFILKFFENNKDIKVIVDTFQNADEANKFLKENMYNMVLLDIVMPGMNSFDFLKIIKKYNSFIQVIMITGNSDFDKLMKAFENGVNDYITKPFDLDLIEEILSDNVKKIKRWREAFQDHF